ncbi:TPA: hypothetical protein ACGOW9_001858, partial [Streptococcus suis]
MLDVTREYIEAIESSCRSFEAEFRVNGQVFHKQDIASIEYDSSIGNSKDFSLGGGYMNSLSVEIKQVVEGLEEMMPATLHLSIDGKSVPIGRFFLAEIKLDRNSKKTKLKLYDEFVRLNEPYESNLAYPTTARRVLEEIVGMTTIRVANGVQLIDDTIPFKLDKVTYREVLVHLATLSGRFVRFNRNGELDFIQLKPTARHITKDMYPATGLEREEIPYRLRGVECLVEYGQTKKTLKEGTTTGNTLSLKNPWMTEEMLSRIFNQYRDLNYYPYKLSWRGDMALEAGDWVTVHWDDNVYFDTPMLSYKLKFDGGLTAESNAKATGASQSSYQYKGQVQRQIEYLDELLTKQGAMFLDTEKPHLSKDGDIWFKPNGGYVEMWERIEGSWIKKADSANVEDIVDTVSTDEVMAKKISAAIANVITLNAKRITAGDLDLARLRIMNGLDEVVTVRDGKVVMNIEKLTINRKEVATKDDLRTIS